MQLPSTVKESGFSSFAKEGWTRPKENAAKHPLKGADGVVVSSYRLFMPNDLHNRWLKQPPLLREGGESLSLNHLLSNNRSFIHTFFQERHVFGFAKPNVPTAATSLFRFANAQDLIRHDVRQCLHLAARPADLDRGNRALGPQTKVNATVG
jgi:hypothetical protein